MIKRFLIVALIGLLLATGMVFIGCGGGSDDDKDSYNNDPGEYAGTWTGTVMSASGTITVSTSGWTLSIPALGYTDTGKFNRNGNSATLYSSGNGKNVGTVNFTSSTTGQIVLNANSDAPGTYTITKQ